MSEKRKQEVEATFILSMHEVVATYGVEENFILEIVQEGILAVPANERGEFQFNNTDLATILRVLRLHRDLGVNIPGAALALELMQEIERLKCLLKR